MGEYKINKNIVIEINHNEMFELLCDFTSKNLTLVNKIIELTLNKKKIACPFPFICKDFPCSNLSCNADYLTNGYPNKMS